MSTKRRKRHSPEQIVQKLRDADAMLNAGKDRAAVLQALEVSEATWRVNVTTSRSEPEVGGAVQFGLLRVGEAIDLVGIERVVAR
jgi:hypothetical protein